MKAGVLPSVFGLLGFLLFTIGAAITVTDISLALTGDELVVLAFLSWVLAVVLYRTSAR